MVKMFLQGSAGRMGGVVAQLAAQREDCEIVAGIDTTPHSPATFPVFSSLASCTQPADVLIDFSHPEATASILPLCAQKQLPCVICTTGLPEDTQSLLRHVATKTAVFYSANMSLGINLLAVLAQRAQAILRGFDIEIVERHHHNKLDAPSGTAILLADAINRQAQGRYQYVYNRQPLRQVRSSDEIGIHAVRGGSIVGDHEVLFAGPDETISLSHSAQSRDVFANGAIAAALFLAGKPAGLYSMEDLFYNI